LLNIKPIITPTIPYKISGKAFLVSTSLFFRWNIRPVRAHGIKKIRFIPCALSWFMLQKRVRYIMSTEPPPMPIEPKNPAMRDTIIFQII
jgi:hypothetical protein